MQMSEFERRVEVCDSEETVTAWRSYQNYPLHQICRSYRQTAHPNACRVEYGIGNRRGDRWYGRFTDTLRMAVIVR